MASRPLIIRVSNLDVWRAARRGDLVPYLLRQSLLGRKEASEVMIRGTAFHAVMEHAVNLAEGGPLSDDTIFVEDGYRFQITALIKIPGRPAFTERRFYRYWDTANGRVILTGKVDLVVGDTVIDYKLTSQYSFERYYESMQWKSYLTLTGLPNFTYMPCLWKEKNGLVNVHATKPTTMHAYKGMELEVEQETLDPADWLHSEGLWGKINLNLED